MYLLISESSVPDYCKGKTVESNNKDIVAIQKLRASLTLLYIFANLTGGSSGLCRDNRGSIMFLSVVHIQRVGRKAGPRTLHLNELIRDLTRATFFGHLRHWFLTCPKDYKRQAPETSILEGDSNIRTSKPSNQVWLFLGDGILCALSAFIFIKPFANHGANRLS